ncbi:MAG: response regulator, partial [Candidatus Devosia euplotis]|nr:response regulator [Candidatus Devosia euplotis]
GMGTGTVVSIYLPRHRVQPSLIVDADLAGTALAGAGQTILAVEDDERVRKLTVARLNQLGYVVMAAGSGAEAIEILAVGKPVDLLFSDVVMPGGMSGFELRTKVQALYPSMPILLTSGYAEELARDDIALDGRLKILSKPYRLADLAAAIDDALKV